MKTITMAAALALLLTACKKDKFDRNATYEVSSNGCILQYRDQYGDMKTWNTTELRYVFQAEQGQELMLTAQPLEPGNRLKASITVNGVTIAAGDISTSTDGKVTLSVPTP